MPVLGLLVLLASLAAPVSAAGTFTNKADLQAALELVVCNQDADALALYGAPDTWDVSAVTDMSYLIGGVYRSSTGISCWEWFNEVRMLHLWVGWCSFSAAHHDPQPFTAFSDCPYADHRMPHTAA